MKSGSFLNGFMSYSCYASESGVPGDFLTSPSNREFVMNDLGHYLFQKTDCVIKRKIGHRVIVSCFGQRNMIYKFFINI